MTSCASMPGLPVLGLKFPHPRRAPFLGKPWDSYPAGYQWLQPKIKCWLSWKSARFERPHHKSPIYPAPTPPEHTAPFIFLIALKIMWLFFWFLYCLFFLLSVSSMWSRELSSLFPAVVLEYSLAKKICKKHVLDADPSLKEQNLTELLYSVDSKLHSFSHFSISRCIPINGAFQKPMAMTWHLSLHVHSLSCSCSCCPHFSWGVCIC